MSTGCFETYSITKSKYVIVGLVLESVLVDINTSCFVCQTSINQKLMRFAWRINAGSIKIFFNSCSCINILKYSNLALILVVFYLDHFPTKHNVDSTLVAFV